LRAAALRESVQGPHNKRKEKTYVHIRSRLEAEPAPNYPGQYMDVLRTGNDLVVDGVGNAFGDFLGDEA